MNTETEPVYEPTWRCYAYTEGDSGSRAVERDEVPALLAAGTRLWLDVRVPSQEDADWLGEVFGFHELTLTDLLNNDVRPKEESYDEVLFTVMKAINLNKGEEQLDTINLNIFLTEQYIVTSHFKPLKTTRSAHESMGRKRDPLSKGTDFLYYLLLDGVVNRYLDVMDEIDEHLSKLEHDVFENPQRHVQEDIFQEKRRLAYLKRNITPKRDAVRNLVHTDYAQIRPETQVLLRDVLDHILRVSETIESYRELTTGLMDSYMSNISNRMNEVMKLMSIIATVMLPLSFLTGVFGMNFEVMPGTHVEYGFWALAGFMGVMVGLLVWYFRRKGIM